MKKWIVIISILLISCTNNIDEDMRLFTASLQGSIIEPPEQFNFQWLGQSNSVSMMNATDMANAGITDLPTDDGNVPGWEYLFKTRPATPEDPIESGGYFLPSELDMNRSTDETYIGFGAQQRLAFNLLTKENVSGIKSLMMSKSGSILGLGKRWWEGSYMVDNNYGIVDLSQRNNVDYDVLYWFQGESNTILLADYQNYEADLITFIAYLHSQYTFTHFVIIKLGHDLTAFSKEPGYETIRDAQENIANDITDCHIVRLDYEMGTKIEGVPGVNGHYDSLAQNRIGELLESYTVIKILNRPFTSELIIETTSTSATWTLNSVINSGNTLRWEVSGGVTIPEQTINNPTLNLSGNTGTATINIKSNNAFLGLTELEFGALSLTKCIVNYAEDLTKIVAVGNPNLKHLNVEGLANLTYLDVNNNGIIYVNFSINPLLTYVDISYNNMSEDINLKNMLDYPIFQLDDNSASNGTFDLSNNPEVRTSASDTALSNLITKGWAVTQ